MASNSTILKCVAALLMLVPAGMTAGQSQEEKLRLRRTPIVEAYERARDSVVNISATQRIVMDRWGLGRFGEIFRFPTQSSVGSGFLIHEDGFIVTNAHVAAQGAQLSVTFADGSEYEAKIVASDRPRDLAVLRIIPDRPLKPIPLGRSDDLMIGEQTIAIGNPVGLQNTVTTGVISALHRELPVSRDVVYQDVIQTDASINPGNSGGPLLNVLGELIGVNTAIRADAQNIGFAIPVSQLYEILPELLNIQKLNDIQLGMRLSIREAGRIVEIREGSPADAADFKLGDVIQSIDGIPIRKGVDFYVAMLDRQAGDTVNFQLRRGGRTYQRRLELLAVPRPDGVALARQRLGIEIEDISEAGSNRRRGRARTGVIVVSVDPRSPADRIGIKPGDLLVSMGRFGIDDTSDLGVLLADVGKDEPIDVGIHRIIRGQIHEYEGRLYAK